MHAESFGHHVLHKIDTMPTKRRKNKRQPRNIRKTEKIKRPEEFTTETLHIKAFHFIVLFILLLPTVKYFLEQALQTRE